MLRDSALVWLFPLIERSRNQHGICGLERIRKVFNCKVREVSAEDDNGGIVSWLKEDS